MDDSARLETRKQYLRIKFRAGTATPDITGLRRYICALGDGAASESVVIHSQAFEGEQASGQIVMEPLLELTAAMAVLAEIDPDNTPAPASRVRFADFSRMPTEA